MSEETYFSLTVLTVFARFRTVTTRVEPTLENAVREAAQLTAATIAAAVAKLGTDFAGVVIPARVAATSLFAGMSERTVGPVVATATRAPSDLEFVHPERVAGVRIVGVGVVTTLSLSFVAKTGT